jgi:hypothetical protein
MRRRALLILASMMLGVLMLGGVALAREVTGTGGSEDLEGTHRADKNCEDVKEYDDHKKD